MKSSDKASYNLSAFRQQAEEEIKKLPLHNAKPVGKDAITEMQVTLLQLQLQNEALLKAMESKSQLADKYSSLYEKSPAGCFALNKDGSIVEVNPNAVLLTGYLKKELLHKNFIELVTPSFQNSFVELFQNAFKTNYSFTCEIEIRNQLNQPVYLQATGIAAKNANAATLVVMDISEQKRISAAAIQSEEKYKMLIEQAYDGVLIYNQEGVLLHWNEKAQKFLRYTHDEFKELRLSDLFFKEELVLRPLSFKKLREGEAVLDYRRLKRKDGSGIEMEINSKMLQDGTVIVFGRDITERKKEEEEKNRLSNTLQKSLDEIFMFNADSLFFEYANDGALKNTGYTEQELYKLTPLDLIPGATSEIFTVLVRPLVKNEKAKIIFENVHKRKDGSLYPVEVHLQIIVQGDKEIFLVNARDITERIKAATELKRAYEILEETNKIARVGGYEIDIKNNTANWTSVTSEIHELPANFIPDIQKGISFYKEGASRDTIIKVAKDAIDNGMPFDEELILITSKGNERWVRVTGRTEFEGGACIRLFGTLQDIHQRKVVEEELFGKEKYFRALIEHSASAIVLFDEKGNFIYQSPVVEKIVGYTPGENEDKNLFDFLHPEDAGNFKKQLFEIINNPDTTQTGEYRFLHASGHYIWLEGSVTNRLQDKNVRALIANYHDVSERKIVAEQIKEEQSLLRTLVDNLPDPIYVKDLEGRKMLANKEDFLYMGIEPDADIIGKTDLELFPGHVGKYGHDTDKSVMKKGEAIYNKEEYFIDTAGNPRWMLTSKVPLRNTDGVVTGLLGIGRDITQSKMAEDALIKSNERYEYATKATFDAIWDWDLTSNEIFWGKNYELLFGHDSSESESNYAVWKNNVHTNDVDKVVQSLTMAIHSKANNWSSEYRFKKSDGEFAFVQDKGIIIRNEEGVATRMIGAMQDITPRKDQEQRLTLMQSVVANTTDAVLITEAEPFDMPGPKILYVNDAFTVITGYSAEEAIGQTPRILQGEKSDRKVLERLKESLKKWEPCEVEIINYKKNGEEFWVNFAVVPIANEHGFFTHWVSIQRDITQRKIAEKNLQSLNDELAKQATALTLSNSELERFAYVASHDLQEPLRMVSSFMKLLEAKYKPQLDDTAKQYIHFAVDGADRMKQLILDLLEYSRVGTNKDNAVNTDMNEVVQEVISILTISINEVNAAIQVGALPVLPNTRRTLMFQLIQNLLSNALKYHGEQQPVIKITALEEQDHWLFAIEDNGIGINPLFAEKIFIIFQRLHNKDQFSGTGIGLSICKKIVEMHGGKIWVEPNQGQGSTFYFTLKK